MEHIHHKDPVRLQEGRKKMISNQILQNTIEGLKAIARVELCIMDIDGKEVAATVSMYECEKPAMEFAQSPADSQEIQGYQYFKKIGRAHV